MSRGIDRTPVFISTWLEANSYRMDGPGQYLGTEPGAFGKPWQDAAVRWLIMAPWPYVYGAGNQSVPAVYASINNGRSDFLADRFYLPETPRDLRMLERAGIPVFGVESKHQLRDFDVASCSIAYSVLHMNFVKFLSLSGVPVRRRDREPTAADWPLVMVGGQAYCTPGFMEPVVDAMWCGEVEDEPGNGGISQVCARIADFKAEGSWQADRIDCYARLATQFDFLHFPRFVSTRYRYENRGLSLPSKHLAGYVSQLPGMRFPRRARKIKDLNRIKPLTQAPLSFAEPASGDVELARGCPAWCSFCRLSWENKPYRERNVVNSVAQAQEWQRNMGSLDIKPFGPDFPMYSRKRELITALLENVNDEVDSSSMRIDDYIADEDYTLLMSLGGTDSIALGLEGNSARMRDLVGKGISDEDVIESVTRAIRAGVRKIKLYMITNLPGEESGDVEKIIGLGRRLAEIRTELGRENVIIQFSWTPLLIEGQTPFQWFAPTPPDHSLIKVFEAFRDIANCQAKIGTKSETNKVAFFQLCQRAGPEEGEAITDVLIDLDTACWGGVPGDMKERLETALLAHGFHNGFADCFDERDRGDLFGWEYLDTGVSTALMWDTYRKMVEFAEGTDADTYDRQFCGPSGGGEWIARCDEKCLGNRCGVCDGEDLRLRSAYISASKNAPRVDVGAVVPIDRTSIAVKIRAALEIPARYRYATSEYWKHAIRRAAYRAQHQLGCDVSISKRSVTLASDAIRDKGWTQGLEVVEFGLTAAMASPERQQFLDAMTKEIAPWATVGRWRLVGARSSLRRDVGAWLWEIEADDTPEGIAAKIQTFAAADYVKVIVRGSGAFFAPPNDEVNAKDHVRRLWAVRDGHRIVVKMTTTGKAGPYALYGAIAGLPSRVEAARHPAICRQVFTASRIAVSDLLADRCASCGDSISAPLLTAEPAARCSCCADEATGTVIATMHRHLSV